MKDKYIDQYGIDSLVNLKIASKAKCDCFITINEDMLKDQDELEKKFKIKVLSPEQALEQYKEKEAQSED